MEKIKYIAFDADDTLWVNEPMFRETEEKYLQMMCKYAPIEEMKQPLFHQIVDNIALYGYGTRGLTLSLIEFATKVSKGKVTSDEIVEILELGKEQLNKEVTLMPNVTSVIKELSKSYRLIVATKGDLLEQEQKLEKSGLLKHFDHVEVMSEKNEANYRRLMDQLHIDPSEFVMIGNSFKSDILPVLNIGSRAIYVPFYSTWAFEYAEEIEHKHLQRIQEIDEVPSLFGRN